MKRGYKKLLIFEILLIVILILNSFVSSILSNYIMIAFLLGALIIFKFLLGFEKDRHRFIKDIVIEEIIFLLIYFIVYYLLGIIFGFAKTGASFYIKNSFTYIVPIVLIVIVKEVLRYMMLKKAEGNKLLVILTCILFIFIDVTNSIYYSNFSSNYETFIFFALTFLPAVSTNITCTYISIKTGYKPVIFYLLIMRLYPYILPIIPNPNNYLFSIINLIVPAILLYRVYLCFVNEKREVELTRDYAKTNVIPLVFSSIVVIVLVYFISGYFKYYALAIASGSMSPAIDKGDVVIIEKVKDKSKINKKEVIAYTSNKTVIVHRLVDKIKVGDEYFFYTKGDANNDMDNIVIKEDMIEGVVKLRIPWIGYPTVWLNEL